MQVTLLAALYLDCDLKTLLHFPMLVEKRLEEFKMYVY